MLVKPEIAVEPPPGMSMFCFDKQTIIDIGVHLNLSAPDSSESLSDAFRKCKICKKSVNKQKMREHVGHHIIANTIQTEDKENICGFCGMSCSSTLAETSRGRGKTFFRKIESLCTYKIEYGKIPSQPSRENPCTNRLLHCSIKECRKVVWSYNIKPHFEKMHPDTLCDVLITNRDITAMKKVKAK